MIKQSEEKFWNDPKNIKWFRQEPEAIYWKEFFESVDKSKIIKVLDLGCGAGRNTEMLARMGFDVFACDLHQGMVNETIKRLSNKFPAKNWANKVVRATMLDLPYLADTFDAIISNGVYHNVSELRQLEEALRETSRVLRTNGYLCFNVFSSEVIAPELKKDKTRKFMYITKEGLDMLLVSPNKFLSICAKYKLELVGKLVEYEREVSTGKRSVMRGILKKHS